MEPNFAAFQLIGQIALGIIGFSAILIGLSRAWLMCFWVMSIYSVIGLIIFPRKMLHLRSLGHKDIFPIKLYLFQTGILSTIFVLSLLMIVNNFYEPSQIYIICLMLFLVQSSVAFIRTMFFRVS